MDDGTVIGRSVDIVEAVASNMHLPLSQLARDTGIPKATAYRLAEALCRRGILARTRYGYVLGSRTADLAAAAGRHRELADARSHLDELLARYGGAAWVDTMSQDRPWSPRPVDLAVAPTVGRVYWPSAGTALATTARGWAALAAFPSLVEGLPNVPGRNDSRPVPNRLQVQRAIARARDIGAFVERGVYAQGWACAAVAFSTPTVEHAVVGVSLPGETRDLRPVIRHLLAAAQDLSRSGSLVATARP